MQAKDSKTHIQYLKSDLQNITRAAAISNVRETKQRSNNFNMLMQRKKTGSGYEALVLQLKISKIFLVGTIDTRYCN